MSGREFGLLITALMVRLIGLLGAFTGVLLLLYFASDIITATGGDTVKTILGAAITVFAATALALSTGLSRDYTEFITALRQQHKQEKES